MSADCHIKIENIDGESTHKDHKGEIDVIDWNWSVWQPTTVGSGVGGFTKGQAVAGEFTFTHRYDKGSPVLAKYCVSGGRCGVVLTARLAGDGQKDFLKVTLKDGMVISLRPSATKGGEIIEEVKLAYTDIEYEYKPTDAKGGQGGAVKFGWDVSSTATR